LVNTTYQGCLMKLINFIFSFLLVTLIATKAMALVTFQVPTPSFLTIQAAVDAADPLEETIILVILPGDYEGFEISGKLVSVVNAATGAVNIKPDLATPEYVVCIKHVPATQTARLEGLNILSPSSLGGGINPKGLSVLNSKVRIISCNIEMENNDCGSAIYAQDAQLEIDGLSVLQGVNNAAKITFNNTTAMVINSSNFVVDDKIEMTVSNGQLGGNGAIVAAKDTSLKFTSSIPCVENPIDELYSGHIAGGQIYEYNLTTNNSRFYLDGLQLTDLLISGAGIHWGIGVVGPATIHWQNALDENLSIPNGPDGLARATFLSSESFQIIGELYNMADPAVPELIGQTTVSTLLLEGYVEKFELIESDVNSNRLFVQDKMIFVPTGGFLYDNILGYQMRGRHNLRLEMGLSENATGFLSTFEDNITVDNGMGITIDREFINRNGVEGNEAFNQSDLMVAVLGGNISVSEAVHLNIANANLDLADIGVAGGLGNLDVQGYCTIGNNVTLSGANITIGEGRADLAVYGNAILDGNVFNFSNDEIFFDTSVGGSTPTFLNHSINIVLPEIVGSETGHILDCRSEDLECGNAVNPNCISGAFRVTDPTKFSNTPNDNWVIESLRLKKNALANLTDRPDMVYYGPLGEGMYVEHLYLEPNAILNLGFQRLYYHHLYIVSSGGSYVEWLSTDGPGDYPDGGFANGSQFKNVPLLGFPLEVIEMNDPTPHVNNETDVRISYILSNPKDLNVFNNALPRGEVELHKEYVAVGDGAYRMATRDATSIQAMASFDRAGSETVHVDFQYKFCEYDADTMLTVWLCDYPDIHSVTGASKLKIATIKPAGSSDCNSTDFKWFSGEFATADLNFLSYGVHVILELSGKDSTLIIDNWDPVIVCGLTCGDFTGDTLINAYDNLILLAQFGDSDLGAQYCLDLNGDGFVDRNDLLQINDSLDEDLGSCGGYTPAPLMAPLMAPLVAPMGMSVVSEASVFDDVTDLVITGFGRGYEDTYGTEDMFFARNYAFNDSGVLLGEPNEISCPGIECVPVNARLVTDGSGDIFQINNKYGLIHQESNTALFLPSDTKTFGYDDVQIGIVDATGYSITDVVFDPNDPDIVYVTPVMITPFGDNDPYPAVAQLSLSGYMEDPNYTVTMVYGGDPNESSEIIETPYSDPNFTTLVYLPDYYRIQEVALDDKGHLLVLTNQYINEEHYIIVYDATSGALVDTVDIYDASNNALNNPTSLTYSKYDDRIYLANTRYDTSGIPNDNYNTIFYFDNNDLTNGDDSLNEPNEIEIHFTVISDPNRMEPYLCDIAVDPVSGTLFAAGFRMPYDAYLNAILEEPESMSTSDPLFATPYLAVIDSGITTVTVDDILHESDNDLALPLSLIWVGCSLDANIDGISSCSVDYKDFGVLAASWGIVDADADIDGSGGIINIDDLAIMAIEWLMGK